MSPNKILELLQKNGVARAAGTALPEKSECRCLAEARGTGERSA